MRATNVNWPWNWRRRVFPPMQSGLALPTATRLRQIPGYEKIMEVAHQRNPNRRLTQPEDVARCIAALCHPATFWLTGNTLQEDGGENIVG